MWMEASMASRIWVPQNHDMHTTWAHRQFSIWNNFNQFYCVRQMISSFDFYMRITAYENFVSKAKCWEVNRWHSFQAKKKNQIVNHAIQNFAWRWEVVSSDVQWRNSQTAPNTKHGRIHFMFIWCDAMRWTFFFFISNGLRIRVHEILICNQNCVTYITYVQCTGELAWRAYSIVMHKA